MLYQHLAGRVDIVVIVGIKSGKRIISTAITTASETPKAGKTTLNPSPTPLPSTPTTWIAATAKYIAPKLAETIAKTRAPEMDF